MVLRHFGNVQTADPAYLFFLSVASILLDFRTTFECQILFMCSICFVPLIPFVSKKRNHRRTVATETRQRRNYRRTGRQEVAKRANINVPLEGIAYYFDYVDGMKALCGWSA